MATRIKVCVGVFVVTTPTPQHTGGKVVYICVVVGLCLTATLDCGHKHT
jgi:hypothetical protein